MSDWDDMLPGVKKPKTTIPEAEKLVVYYQQYAEILKKYEDQVNFIWGKLEDLRKEREDFMTRRIPEIRASLEKQQIDPKYREEWIDILVHDTTRSLTISENLLKAFYVDTAKELRKEINEKLSIGGDSRVG